MRSRPNVLYSLVNGDFYETFDRYHPRTHEFHELVLSRLPSGWTLHRQQIWFVCSSPWNTFPEQGWKIHVSTSLANAREVLDRVSALLFQRQDASFKFLLDVPVLQLVNGKGYPRSGSAKFITIYPRDSRAFLELLELLRQRLQGLHGPYVLSDRRYKDSGVVFYRYGGMCLREVLTVKGEKVAVLTAPDGSTVPDQRLPYPTTPHWVSSPLPQEDQAHDQETGHSLRQGRYVIQSVISFSSAGGVYKGRDQITGRPVVIKEARPRVNESANGYDAVSLLVKEYRLLGLVAETGIAPQPVDCFQEWEHWFLVEEFIDGMMLSSHSAAHNILLRTRPTPADYEEWGRMFYEISMDLIRVVEVLHRHGIIFADLSPNNLMVLAGKTSLKLIDFEGAYQTGHEHPTSLFTPGFVAPDRLQGAPADVHGDYYSIGAVLFSYLFPWNGLIHLKREAAQELVESMRRDARLPQAVAATILRLIDRDPSRRPAPARIRSMMKEPFDGEDKDQPSRNRAAVSHERLLSRIVEHWKNTAAYDRRDRLFPSDARLFATNPLSLAYGACGVAYAWQRIVGKVPEEVIQWIQQRPLNSNAYPPGLYVGLPGIAWCLLEIGQTEDAQSAMRMALAHPQMYDAYDIFYGIAGWGMASLRFWTATADKNYLEASERAGNQLVAQAQEDERGCYWGPREGARLGLAHGSSGVALFLLYLYIATRDERFLSVGKRALDFDLSFAVQSKDGGLTWPRFAGSQSPVYPFWEHGSAGIGIAVARYYRLLRDSCYEPVLEQIYVDTDRKYAVSAGKFTGLAGLGDFLLDMHDMTGQPRFQASALRLAEGIMNFQVEREGAAFPGSTLFRLSSDFGTGSAGVALFLNRLAGKQKSDFLLDSLFAADVGLSSDREQATDAVVVRS